MDGLIPLAEEITLAKEKKVETGNNPFTRVAADKPPGSPRELASDASEGEVEDKEEVTDKKAHKKLVKLQQSEKRKLKKQLKQAFQSSLQAETAKTVVQNG